MSRATWSRTLDRSTRGILVAVVLAAVAVPAAADRVSDSQVKSLLADISTELEKLDKMVPAEHRDARVEHESGAMRLSELIERLGATTDEVASSVAGAEPPADAVRSLLVGGKDLIGLLEENRWVPFSEGRHPWTTLWNRLERLAEAYSADYSADPASWEIERMSDAELAELTSGLRTHTQEFETLLRAELERRKSKPAVQKAALANLEKLRDSAATISADGRSGADAEEATERLIEHALAVDRLLAENGLTKSLQEPWHEVEESVSGLHRAYHPGPMEGYNLLSEQ
jgi:hypothetical protein